MKTIDKYLIKEMVPPFLAGMLIILVLWVGNIVFLQVSVLKGKTELLPLFLQYVLLKSMYYVTLSLAAGSLFGCALAISRLTRDSEITVMRMAGTSVKRIFVPFLLVGVLVSAAAFFVQEKAVPWAEKRGSVLLQRLYLVQRSPLIQADVFFNWQNYYFYIQQIERKGPQALLKDVTVWELPAGSGYPMVTTAKSATWINQTIEMRDGVIHKFGKDGFTEYEAKFKTMELNLKRQIEAFFESQRTPEQMSTAELAKQIDMMSKSGIPISNMRLDYHFKLSIPFSSIILILCTAPLGLRFGRHSSFAGALLGIVVVFLYWNVMLFAKVFGQAGWLPPALAGWSQIIIFSAIGAILVWKAE
ncbi:MAG: LptF/LptG family permease [Armatimonadota bacterium]|nr:LptF/LptG family permease [Armatimonadota bacterium]